MKCGARGDGGEERRVRDFGEHTQMVAQSSQPTPKVTFRLELRKHNYCRSGLVTLC